MDRKTPAVDVQRILEILSDMYPNRAVAVIRENLQNSIDGGARNVWIRTNLSLRLASFTDDGRGVPMSSMNENGYFGLVWSTKRDGQLMIGGKGIGRLTNIAVAKKVIVNDNDRQAEGSFAWYPNGEHERVSTSSPIGHSGVGLNLIDVAPAILRDIDARVVDVVVDYFDDFLKRSLSVWHNGVKIEHKQFPGVKKVFSLSMGAQLELFWHARGHRPEDVGILVKCMGVKVTGPMRLGIESSEWRNLAGVLNLDRFKLTSNRDSFEDTPEYRLALQEAAAKVRAVLARYEGGRQKRLDKVASEYTRAAREALKELDIDLAILGRLRLDETNPKSLVGGTRTVGPRVPEGVTDYRRPRGKEAGDRSGFRLVPTYFRDDPDLVALQPEMSCHRGAEILVNLGHAACPKNRNSRSYYIWGACFAEIIRLGSLSSTDSLDKERFLKAYRGWLQAWSPELVKVTPGEE